MLNRVTHLVFDGVADGALGVGLDIVAAAARLSRPPRSRAATGGAAAVDRRRGALAQRVLSVDGAAVRTAAGRALPVDGALALRAMGSGDVVVVPGLGLATPAAIAAGLARPDLVRGALLLARAHARGVTVAASCSATFVLASSGVLDGRQATTTWWLAPTFAQRFPRVRACADRMVVESRGIFTAGSAFAHADLLLAILARKLSPTLAHEVARYLILDERSSQARYMVMSHLGHADPLIRALEAFVTANLERQLTIEEMARATATSPRTLARRVGQALATTPQRFAQRLRVARAVHLLETTRRSVDEVTARVGYADAAAFRRIFRRETGETLSARRARARLA